MQRLRPLKQEGRRWALATSAMAELCLNGTPSSITFNSAASAASSGLQWQLTLRFFFAGFEEATSAGVEPDPIGFSTVIGACQYAMNWSKALEHMNKASAVRLTVIVSARNAATMACTELGVWLHALALLDPSQGGGLQRDAVSFAAAAGACREAKRWQHVLALRALSDSAGMESEVMLQNAAHCAWRTARSGMQNFAMALKAVLIGSELFPEADFRLPAWGRMGSSAAKQASEDLCNAVKRGDLAGCHELLQRLQQNHGQSHREGDVTASLLNEISSSCGMAPLHLAVATSRFDIASLLMDRAADVNVRDAQQRTPLHFAALTPNARLVQELLGRRADPFCATELGRTPLDIARDVSCVGSVRALEGASALWQGPVDAFQPKMLGIPSWSPKWLVVLLDRRHNTGPSFFARGNVHNVFKKAQNLMRDNLVGPDAAHQCPHCYKTNAIPDFVESFPCCHCGRMLSVPASLQLALYDYTQGVPDARPMAVLPLPQDVRCIHVKSLEDPTAQPAGWLRQKLGGLGLTSSRNHGFSVRVEDHAKEATWDLRFATSLECAQARSAVAFAQRCPRTLILKETYDRMLLELSAPQEEELPIPSAPPADEGEEQPAVAPPPPEPLHQASHSVAPAQAPPREPPHQAAQTPAPAQVISQDGQERADQDDGMCVVCLERRADTAVVPCGHLCLCQNCVADVMGQRLCPMCRNEASSTVRIYPIVSDQCLAQRWKGSLQLLAEMEEAKVEADAVSYEAAVQTCELGGQPGPAALVLGLCQSRSWLLGRPQ
eukprot:s270_g16.t2